MNDTERRETANMIVLLAAQTRNDIENANQPLKSFLQAFYHTLERVMDNVDAFPEDEILILHEIYDGIRAGQSILTGSNEESFSLLR